MKKILVSVLAVVVFFSLATAQENLVTPVKHKIAIFAPLYLDSAFDATDTYRYASNKLPEFISPGLEFYEGAQLALDSMAKEGIKLEVYVYDIRSTSESLNEILSKPELDSIELMLVHCNGNEIRQFAEAGFKRNIPVVNANVPVDGGIKGNPFYVMLNSTLKTHCEGIYRHVQKNYATNPVIMFRRKGQTEDMIKSIFDQFSKNTLSVPLKIKYIDLPDSFTVNNLTAHLDSNRQFLCIAGSLNESFGKRLAQQLASINKTYHSVLVGMPTWDAIKDFTKPEYKDLEIVYGTPFYNAKTDKTSTNITNFFNVKMYARPSDMVFRGYEVTWKYAKLLLQYEKDIASNLANKQYKVFADFDIQPVLSTQNMTLDYFENKKIYFLKWQNGVIKSVY